MHDEVSRLKAQYARAIEHGKKVEMFTNTPEFQWYVEHVLKPTIYENTQRIMRGDLKSEKEDWVTRGIVQGLQMVIDGTEGIKHTAENARKEAKQLQEEIEAEYE